MKLLLVLSLITISLFTACSKPAPASPTSIAGSWELRYAQNGMIPTKFYAEGNGNMLVFTATDYKVYTNGQVIKTGTYKIIKDNTSLKDECLVIVPGQYFDRIVYDNDLTQSKRLELTATNKLEFSSGCPALDSGSFVGYEKQ